MDPELSFLMANMVKVWLAWPELCVVLLGLGVAWLEHAGARPRPVAA